MALAAARLAVVFFLFSMSIVRNIRERKDEKFNRRRVSRCFGFSVIAPVEGSIIICCRLDDVKDTIIPLADPGAAM